MELERPMRGLVSRVLGTLVVLVVAGVCARLGVWQLDRLAERKSLNEVISARMSEPLLEIRSAPVDTAGLPYRVVEVVGEYDVERGVVLAGRSHQGAAGAHLLLPLRLEDGSAVLVQAGWLPTVDAGAVDPARYAEGGTIHLQGLLLDFPRLDHHGTRTGAGVAEAGVQGEPQFRRVWYRLDREGLRGQLPYPVAELYLQRLPASIVTADYPVPLPAPDLDDGPHLGYAIQWFSFGVIALVGWTILLARRREPVSRR